MDFFYNFMRQQYVWTMNIQNEVKIIEVFLSEETGISVSDISIKSDLLKDLGIDGDDAVELIIKFGDKFGVDIQKFNYQDYFGLEGAFCPLFLLMPSWWKRKHIKSLTVSDLIDAVKKGKLE